MRARTSPYIVNDDIDQIGAIESVKAASDIYTPVSGEIVNANEQLTDYPGLINKSPEDEGSVLFRIMQQNGITNLKEKKMYTGWFVKIKMYDHKEANELMDDIEYAAYCDSTQEQ